MKTPSRKRYALLASGLLIAGGFSLACLHWLRTEQQKYSLNRQLIEALKKKDTKTALALVNAGADPNTRYKPTSAFSMLQLVNQLLHHTSRPINDSPTAFWMACGAGWIEDKPSGMITGLQSDSPQLVQAMLRHGANVNAIDANGGLTALMWATGSSFTSSMTLLLQHGAIIDLPDDDGDTALHRAVWRGQAEAVKVLLNYHANVNSKDQSGRTPLQCEAEIYHRPPETPSTVACLLISAGATK